MSMRDTLLNYMDNIDNNDTGKKNKGDSTKIKERDAQAEESLEEVQSEPLNSSNIAEFLGFDEDTNIPVEQPKIETRNRQVKHANNRQEPECSEDNKNIHLNAGPSTRRENVNSFQQESRITNNASRQISEEPSNHSKSLKLNIGGSNRQNKNTAVPHSNSVRKPNAHNTNQARNTHKIPAKRETEYQEDFDLDDDFFADLIPEDNNVPEENIRLNHTNNQQRVVNSKPVNNNQSGNNKTSSKKSIEEYLNEVKREKSKQNSTNSQQQQVVEQQHQQKNNALHNNPTSYERAQEVRAQTGFKEDKPNPFTAHDNSKRIPNKPYIDGANYQAPPEGDFVIEEGLVEDIEVSSVEENDEPDVMKLLQESETCYPDEWLTTYESAQRSKKTNDVAKKLKNGRFRIDKDHMVVILPDMKTHGESSFSLLNKRWNLD